MSYMLEGPDRRDPAAHAVVWLDAHWETQVGMSEDDRDGVLERLEELLADEHVLYTKTRNCHWNVVGPRFPELRALFEKQYQELGQVINETAERIRALGATAVATLTEYLALSRLRERPGERPDDLQMMASLLADHEFLIRQLREDLDAASAVFHDRVTSGLLCRSMGWHERAAWKLRALLAGQRTPSPQAVLEERFPRWTAARQSCSLEPPLHDPGPVSSTPEREISVERDELAALWRRGPSLLRCATRPGRDRGGESSRRP